MEHRNNLAEATQRQRDAQVEPEPYGSEARLFQEHVLPSVVGWHFQGTLKPGPESTEAVSQGPLSWCGLGQLWLLQVEVSDSLWGGGVLLIPLPAQASGVGVLVACPPPPKLNTSLFAWPEKFPETRFLRTHAEGSWSPTEGPPRGMRFMQPE